MKRPNKPFFVFNDNKKYVTLITIAPKLAFRTHNGCHKRRCGSVDEVLVKSYYPRRKEALMALVGELIVGFIFVLGGGYMFGKSTMTDMMSKNFLFGLWIIF